MTTDAVGVLYGSAARGDSDELSDVDVLIIAEAEAIIPKSVLPRGAQVSEYDWSEWQELARTGSIFLHHLRGESRVLWSVGQGAARYEASLLALPDYAHVERDFNAFEEAIESIGHEIEDEGASIEFEISALAMIVRHLSILICYLADEVNFSRVQSLRMAADITGAASSLRDDFDYIYEFRLFSLGRTDKRPAIPSHERVKLWIDESRNLIKAGRRLRD